MPTTPTYPGVYIEEIPSGVRTIVGVATSIAAFVDFCPRGLLDEAVHIFSFADFEREFGGLDTRSEASYGVQQFFLNGGTEAYVVRVGEGSIGSAHVTLKAAATDIVNVTAGRRIRGEAAANPGVWGNALRVEVDYDTTDPNELFNLTVVETEQRAGRTVVRQTEVFRNVTMRPGVANNAIESVNENSRLVQLNRDGLANAIPDPFDPTFRPDPTATLSGPLTLPAAIPADGAATAFQAHVTPGGGAPAFDAPVQLNYGGATVADYASLRPFLEAAIRAGASAASQADRPLLADATVQLVNNHFRVLLGRSGAGFQPDATIAFADTGATTAADLHLTTGAGALVRNQQIPLTGGDDGDPPSAAALRGVRANKTGMYALEDVSLFNILCFPRAAEIALTDAPGMRSVYAEAEPYCQERRAFLIIDIPQTANTLDAIQTWLTQNESLRDRNAAAYFPRVRIPDPLNQNRLRSVGASGTMAGLYAATDAARGVWKAPAGIDVRLRNVQDLDYILTDRENGAINPLGMNALRNFPIIGNVSWGARTLDGADALASEWKYIPVRRLALFLEESLFRGTKFAVFEPNDEPLWAQIRLNVGAFMQGLFRQGAFQGSTPREAYLVKCDKETTTQADINLGIVNIVVGFAPLKPAEFVIIKIQQLAGQIPT
ncbi:MAG TPA: phage tail sheath C-terminal domain-containing protein [Bryobacteraceae bacterium]|nr:phage tail sheath C-terminal domain-containing protein [Bryobacteraceae bacterium]